MSAITKHDMKVILGEDFFKEEVRCDYLVSAEMKRIWAVLLDMYLAFAETCDKYGLKHFVVGGTLLGTIRHNGFIPWDDDLDIGMLREDYEEFLKIASKELKYPLFLQTPFTDKDYYISFAKIRNSTTTGLSKILCHRRFNQGLFIDILPYDYVDLDKVEEDRISIFNCAKKCGVYMREGSKYLNDSQKQDRIKYHTIDPLSDWKKIQEIASNPNYKQSGFIGCTIFTGTPLEKCVFPALAFEKTVKHRFEKTEVFIPIGWESILKVQFGNYNVFPPVKERGVRHSGFIFDSDNPYTNYLE